MKKKLLSFFSLTAIAILAFAATQASRRASTTLWENAEGVAVNWNGDVTVEKAKLASLKVGDILTVSVKNVVAGATKDNWNAQVSLRDSWWNGLEQDVAIAETDTKAEFVLTGDILKILKERGLMISGKGFSATKIEVSDGTSTGSDYSVMVGSTDGKPVISKYHFMIANGGYNDNSSGSNVWKNGVKAGDILRVTASAKEEGDKYFLLCYPTEGWPGTEMTKTETAKGYDFVVGETNVSELMANGAVVNQAGYTITQIELLPGFAVNVEKVIQGGSITVDKTAAAEGDEVTITATPNDGYKLLSYSVTGVNTNQAVTVTNGKFKMPADAVNVSATFVQPEDITISPASGDIAAALKAAKEGKIAREIHINLAENGAYTLSEPIEAGAGVFITTNGEKPATIDASANTGAFILMSKTPAVAGTTVGTNEVYNVAEVSIRDVEITGLPYQLFYANGMRYLIGKLIVENSVIGINGTNKKTIFDFAGRGNAEELSVNKSTLWANPALAQAGGLFSCQSGDWAGDLGGTKQILSITNSTLYNISYGKNTCAQRQNSKAGMGFVVKNSIIANCGKSGQFIVGLDGGGYKTVPTWEIDTNSINYDGADVNAAESAKIVEGGGTADVFKNGVPGVVAFTDAANGNFKLANCAQNTAHIGDPRWLDATVEPEPEDIVISPASGDIIAALFEATTGANKKAKNITINLAANGSYKATASIEAPASVTIAGPATLAEGEKAPTIDASGNADAFIQMSATPTVEKNTKEYYVVDVALKNAKITGVKNSLFWDNKVKYCVENFTIDNCVIDIPAETVKNDAIISFQGGGAKTFSLTNSTISGAAKVNYFLRYNGNNGRIDNMGYDKNTEKQTWIYENNTFYQVLKSNGQWGNGPAGQNYFVYSVKNNIWYNSSQDIARRLLNGQLGAGSDVTFDKNTYFNGDADVSDKQTSYDKSGTALTSNPTFKDAANGDFTIGASTAQAKEKTGDPRWLVEYVAPAKFYIFGDVTEAGWSAVTTEVTFNAETQAYEYDFVATKDVWFAFSDTEFAATAGNWEAVNAARYSLGDAEVTVGTAQDLVKGVDKSVKMPAGTWKARISKDLKTLTITGEAAPPPAEDTYVVAGNNAAVFGAETTWSTTAEANQMTKNAETGIYEKKYTGIAFTEATTIEYKIVKNGSTWIPADEDNKKLEVAAAGTYDVTFTYNATTGDITGVATVSTGINGISADGAADIFSDGKPVYNLSGQRVFKGYKGVVIKNGKKVVVK